MELVAVQFRRPCMLFGRALHRAGEIAGVTPDEAAELCAEPDPTATLYKAPDAPPMNKMIQRPAFKKGSNG